MSRMSDATKSSQETATTMSVDREHLVAIGRKGGQSRSPRKAKWARINAQRARQVRAEKRLRGEGK